MVCSLGPGNPPDSWFKNDINDYLKLVKYWNFAQNQKTCCRWNIDEILKLRLMMMMMMITSSWWNIGRWWNISIFSILSTLWFGFNDLARLPLPEVESCRQWFATSCHDAKYLLSDSYLCMYIYILHLHISACILIDFDFHRSVYTYLCADSFISRIFACCDVFSFEASA